MEQQIKSTTASEKKQSKAADKSVKPVGTQATAQPPASLALTPAQPAAAPAEDKKPAEEKKPAASKPLVKKEKAVARGLSLPISKKHAMYICSFIKNKRVEAAIEDLEDVLKFKRAVPFKGEIPHRHGMMSGRYPINASKAFISVLKGLRGNIAVAGLAPDKARIAEATASWASRSQKRDGARFKRTHVIITAREIAQAPGGKK